MPTDNRGKNAPVSQNQTNNSYNNSRELNLLQPDIAKYSSQQKGYRERQLIIWRVPDLGFIEMYINPQQMQINEKKAIQRVRTKGGFVVQYWGEEATTISIDGNTGSSGVEGINVLRNIYRSEQEAFQKVSKYLQDRFNSFSVGGTLSNVLSATADNTAGKVIGQAMGSMFGSGPNPPLLPTLGSLAMSVEMFYQGLVFKGYFENFDVTESVQNGAGVFTYRMTFIALDRRGIRTNFMPWHRSPAYVNPSTNKVTGYTKSDSEHTPLTFGGEE